MTIKDLKDKLMDMDDSDTIMLQRSDGTQMDIKDASMEEGHLTFWTDSSH